MRLCLVVIAVTLSLAGVKGTTTTAPTWPPYHYSNCARPGTYNQTGPGVIGPAPPVPVLPNTFQIRVEANILNKQMTVVATEYVDKPNNRAALRLIQNNSLDYMIFDDNNNQLIYDVNGNCYAKPLNSDINRPMFGIKMPKNSSIPHIYSTTGALEFAVSNGLTYMGKTTVRGIKVDHWLSCMYWPNLLSNFTLDFYWSSPNWTDSVWYPQVPVRAQVRGQAPGGVTLFHNFNHTYEYYDFRDHIWGDDSVFETPKGKVCANRKQTRTVPQLAGQYSYREEIVLAPDKIVTQTDIWYDYNYKLMRFDFRPAFSSYPSYTTNPVTEIHDYNTGIAYILDRVNANCTIIPIQNSTFGSAMNMTTKAHSRSQFFLQMTSPASLFYLDNKTYTYEGKRTIRGMLCDVFISQRTDFQTSANEQYNSTFEFYFLDKSWTAVNNVGSKMSQARDIPVRLDITTPQWVGYNASYNFYNFDEEDPSLNSFNIKTCFNSFSQMPFMITFGVSFDSSLNTYNANFLKATLDTLSRVAHVNKLRIQSPEFHMQPDQGYFVGTLVALPPSTAYFRKLSGLYQLFNNDKSLTVDSARTCADQCNAGKALASCDSFDYCASKNLCTLSLTHTEDGKLNVSKGQCDHYSRTTQNPDQQFSLTDVWRMIRNNVYSGDFQMPVFIGNGVTKTYKATAVKNTIQQNSQRQTASQNILNNFNVQYNKAIPHYDDLILTGLAVDDCATECQSRNDWVCNSFEYQYRTSMCTLSKLHPDERPGVVVNTMLTDLYSRKYTAQYQKIPGKTLLSQSQAIYENIYTADMCAKLCSNYNGFNCLSFDYCDDLSTCYLGKMHFYDAPKANIRVSPSCNHYSRNYLYDFKRYSRKTFANVADRLITGVDVSQCAKLCVQQETINCAGFDYCGNATTCRLTTASLKNIGQMTLTANLWCDVYNRQTLPDGTPYVNKPCQGHTNNNATMTPSSSILYTTSTSISVNYSSLPFNSGDKYSGGAMAGIAFGMLIAGILLTVGAFFLLARFRGKQHAGGIPNMAYVKEDESVYKK